MAAKRLHDGYEQDPDQPEDKRMRRLPSFSTVIREAVLMKQAKSIFIMLEPLFRRVVQEELQAGLVGSPRYIERTSPETPSVERATWRLAFRKPPRLPVFTGSKIEGDDGEALQIVVVDVETGSPLAPAPPLRIELVPLFGDFPPDGREDWAADEFQANIVKERAGKRPLLTGDVSLTMRDGCVAVGELQFTDNSSWVRCRKFRIGVRVTPGSFDGARILEAMSDAFVVRDHRGELYKKHYPPLLADDVWRLEKIGKDGAFHRKLSENRVKNVQEFLRMLTVQPDHLRSILGDGMTDRMWEVTTNHAKTCAAGDKLYAYSGQHATVYVNSIFDLVKIELAGGLYVLQHLTKDQKMYVQQLYMEAYEHRFSLQEVDDAVLHGHGANTSVSLLQNAAALVAPPPPPLVETPIWLPATQDIDFDEVPQANYALQTQWASGQIFNMPG